MPRRIVLSNVNIYRGYSIKDKYSYDQKQLDRIIDTLEFYKYESTRDPNSNYVVFDITIKVKNTSSSPYFNPYNFDDGYIDYFNPNDLKVVLPDDYYFYRWTREWSEKNQEHYHLMVIANHPAKTGFIERLHNDVASLTGVKSAFISPRLLSDDDHRSKIHFHWLSNSINERDGLRDCINRHSYRAKLDQKLDFAKRTFDGCRNLKPLLALSTVLENKQINRLLKVA